MNRELENLLLQCKNEIGMLRRDNEILHAKQSMIDLFAATLYGSPATQSMMHTQDIKQSIDDYIEKNKDK